ncbi:serine hydrolase FSH, partial [Bisporella sp. PMI_857]
MSPQPESSGERDHPDTALGLDLPRIVCLHGGGTNARIFRAQCRIIRAHLLDSFRLVFADAPFPSQAGPDVTPVFGDWGPFRAWLPLPAMNEPHIAKIDECITTAMAADDLDGARGSWVGLLGFSQGARVAASLLLREQRLNQSLKKPGRRYRFAVLLAGRGPLMDMSVGDGSIRLAPKLELLQLPTIHVHGLRDPGIEMHRELLHCCLNSSAKLVEWDGDHRVPITTKDVGTVVAEIR